MPRKPQPPLPAAGGAYTRHADGSLKQTAASTRPHPGKTQLASEAAADSAAKARRAAPDNATKKPEAHQ